MKPQFLSLSTLVIPALLATNCSSSTGPNGTAGGLADGGASSGGNGNHVGPADSSASSSSGGDADSKAVSDASGSLGAGCTYTPRPIGLNDMTPLGVTAAQLLARVSGTRSATLTWGVASPGQDVTVYPAGTTTLTIDITPMDSSITYSQAAGGVCAPGPLTIAASVHFVTTDGGFNETWQESLFSNDGRSLTFYHNLQQTPPAGIFRVTYAGTQIWSSIETTLMAIFDDQGARGNVQYATATMSSTGPNSSGGGGLIVQAASWLPPVGDAGVNSDSADAGDAGADARGVD